MRKGAGISILEAIVAIALIGLCTVILLPALASTGSIARTGAGARQIAMTLHAMRWNSVAHSKSWGLLFEREPAGWRWLEVQDGNANGLRSVEIANGTDRVVSGPHRLQGLVPSVTFGFPGSGPYPAIPPGAGPIANLDDPIQFGRSNIVSFNPLGGASSGTLYVTDGRDGLFGVVLFGRTARVRVWRYDAREGQWTL